MDDEIDRMIAEGSPVPPEPEDEPEQQPYDWKAEGDYPRIEVPYAE